ncbi:hypothetical protein M9H77_02978 [Catharanthus roseus]|uniref:Uncharacterized protein n=1 Tax=Catharanthus roseus TaxID=4058 RepID=A0ACC0CA38_CATRO|nr:hypothetical protein M9H77_02978 [Catharanthus roseus]
MKRLEVEERTIHWQTTSSSEWHRPRCTGGKFRPKKAATDYQPNITRQLIFGWKPMDSVGNLNLSYRPKAAVATQSVFSKVTDRICSVSKELFSGSVDIEDEFHNVQRMQKAIEGLEQQLSCVAKSVGDLKREEEAILEQSSRRNLGGHSMHNNQWGYGNFSPYDRSYERNSYDCYGNNALGARNSYNDRSYKSVPRNKVRNEGNYVNIDGGYNCGRSSQTLGTTSRPLSCNNLKLSLFWGTFGPYDYEAWDQEVESLSYAYGVREEEKFHLVLKSLSYEIVLSTKESEGKRKESESLIENHEIFKEEQVKEKQYEIEKSEKTKEEMSLMIFEGDKGEEVREICCDISSLLNSLSSEEMNLFTNSINHFRACISPCAKKIEAQDLENEGSLYYKLYKTISFLNFTSPYLLISLLTNLIVVLFSLL